MANLATPGGVVGSGSTLSVRQAIRIAWVVWVVLLVIPFLLFMVDVWEVVIRGATSLEPARTGWFLAASVYLLVAVPASFFWRGHVFKGYWSGQTIAPGKYLFGMISMWAALVIGGIFSLIGCLVDRSLLPNLLPALVAFMFYVTLWPSGRAMVRHVGHLEDASMYEEPR
jgi:hypothetical protein